MPNHPKFGHETASTMERKGEHGYVKLMTDVLPNTKTRIIQLAIKEDKTIKQIVNEALLVYLKVKERNG